MATGKDILAIAAREIGVKESPAGSNRVKYNKWFYGKDVSGAAYPWCMAFVQWVYEQSGMPLPLYTASCGALLGWYQQNKPQCIVKDPIPGCIVIFDFPGTPYVTDHTGIFESRSGDYVTTIDGNTGTGNEANGGAVMRRSRHKSNIRAYIVPWELAKGEPMEKEETTVSGKRYNTFEEIEKEVPWAAGTVQRLMDKGILKGDGAGLDLSRDMLRLLVLVERMQKA